MELDDEITVEVIALDRDGHGLAHRGDNIITIPQTRIGDKKKVVLKKKTLIGYKAELLEETKNEHDNSGRVPRTPRGESSRESSEETITTKESREERAVDEWLVKAAKVRENNQPRNQPTTSDKR